MTYFRKHWNDGVSGYLKKPEQWKHWKRWWSFSHGIHEVRYIRRRIFTNSQMGRIIDTLAITLITVSLLTAGVHAGHHDSLEVSAQNEYTMTVDDNALEVTFIVNNTASRPVQNATLTVTNISKDLELRSNETVELDRFNASETRLVSVTVYVPEGTPEGNYSISIAVQQGNHTLDNATGVVTAEYDGESQEGGQTTESSTENDDSLEEETTDDEGGGGAVGVTGGSDSGSDLADLWPVVLLVGLGVLIWWT